MLPNEYSGSDLSKVFNVFADNPSLRDRYDALRRAAREIAIWFSGGSRRYRCIGENAGDGHIKITDTKLKDLAVHVQGEETLFIGWLSDDTYRETTGINGHEHSETIRIVSVRGDVVEASDSNSWTSKNDDSRSSAYTPGMQTAKIAPDVRDGRLWGVLLIDDTGNPIHDFGSVHSYNYVSEPYKNFNGMSSHETWARLHREP
jgi:hypothetical protein